ncbi:MAG: RagB/SusD family nutrient uptake outer membrane protein [Bacteroidales bacterium]|nr:RagB/SusD family nutrient uptake outer membrane protein [Bacteroidales bacterium]
MKALKKISYGFFAAVLLLFSGCEDYLKEEVHSQLAPSNFLSSKAGMENVLASGYSYALVPFFKKQQIGIQEWCTDIAYNWRGNWSLDVMEFSWDPLVIENQSGFGWYGWYSAIRNSNIVLENVDEADVSQATKSLLSSEARFIRAYSYYQMFLNFGPVPLRKSTNDPLKLPRASEEEMLSFIETEVLEIIPALPDPGDEPNYQRAHKGAARAMLCEFYLNTKQWQKGADMAQDIINMGIYELYPDYVEMFKVENEKNSEFIWVIVCDRNPNRAMTNGWMNSAFPLDFQRDPITGLEWQDNFDAFKDQFSLRDVFVNTFSEDDTRDDNILKSWINKNGDTIVGLGNNNAREFKYLDVDAGFRAHGNDYPIFRFADVLMLRAEALNELNGPNQVSLDLINMVRERAGLEDLSLGDFSTKEALRDHILLERGWELRSEGKRRLTLIRMGKFIENAHDILGISYAQPHHTRFPLPQVAMDANELLEQNPGY